MKTGGLALAALLLIGGLLRITGPLPASPLPAQEIQKTTARTGITKTDYPDEMRATIQSFCGTPPDLTVETTSSELKTHWNVPEKGRSAIRHVIAVLPDPAHTHLALFFDRGIDSLVQAAQKKGYVFDRAILPWDRAAGADPSDPEAREAQAASRAAREAYPGLLIFRSERGPRTDDPDSATESSACSERSTGRPAVLFVFVVGETPTGGLRKEQFRNARKIIREIGEGSAGSTTSAKKPMLILGPTFSGSLDSLHQEVTEAAAEFHETYIYSGTVTSARSIAQFDLGAPSTVQFASFQENDDYALAQFARFARYRGYTRNKIAVLSEDATTYGAQRVLRPQTDFEGAPLDGSKTPVDSDDAIQLHFPREISYFRSAYQKETASQQSSASPSSSVATLPPDLSEGGNDDDAVPPFAGAQTSRTQEAVMLGIVSELQKHHIEFTVLLATDPVDELFLARYLRHTYPQGRVVIISPDLLFFREQDPTLVGVLGLNTYTLVPGLNDRLCSQKEISGVHEDRLFVSSSSVGTFNAMVGLLSLDDAIAAGWNPGPRREPTNRGSRFVPQAPYVEYGTPLVQDSSDETGCQKKPLLWITLLSRDGFWPLVGIGEREFVSADHQEPIAQFRRDHEVPSTLKVVSGDVTLPERKPASMPGAWSMAYCLCLILLVAHTFLSWNGTILADSEVRAQFARNRDVRATIVLALGALALAAIFIVLMATRTPIVTWTGGTALTFVMWLPFPVFVALAVWDIAELRGQPSVALAFGIILFAFLGFQLYLASYPSEYLRTYWSVRLPHITSGVSPILPVLLLFAAGYWWMWMSLRGISLVDLRRPRLPDKKDLCNFSYRITDCEGEQLRETAHPFFFVWQVLLPVAVLALLFLTVVDLKHPVQTIEGWAYDWGFSLLLALMIATFLGSLLKLVNTWLKCRQILSGLDRTPLRYAFSRMKNLSWHSFWNPGGSTLRETYKIMSRALENLERLERVLLADTACLLTPEHRAAITAQFRETDNAKTATHNAYVAVFADENGASNASDAANASGGSPAAAPSISTSAARFLGSNILRWCLRKEKEATLLKDLTAKFEALQKSMSKTAAVLVCNLLLPWWPQEETPVVSEDARLDTPKLSLTRTLAEEFVALVYVNFLVTVLLRMRTLVICAGGLYVFIVLATAVYPFEPHPALQSLTVVLLLVMGAAVGFVYAEMHREAILSRLTSTPVGELGVDFWLKLASAGAIPLFSLLAAQFPQINQVLFSWLEPALQAVK